MNCFRQRDWLGDLYRIALTLWVGGSWGIGYLVVPILFAKLPDRQMAGMVAGWFFEAVGWIGLVVGLLLAIFWVARGGFLWWRRAEFWVTIGIACFAAVLLFFVQPAISEIKARALPLDVMQSPLRTQFVFWHGTSSILYLLQSLLGLWLVLRSGRLGADQRSF